MNGRAMVFHGSGSPLEQVRYEVPRPQGGEILVRVTCCTLCRSDLHTYTGRRNEPTPLVLGHEITGRVEAVGPDVRGVPIGERVTWPVVVGCGSCFFCDDALPQKCERLYKYGHARGLLGGGLADHVLLRPGTTILRIPAGLSDRVIAPANCATATAAAVLRAAGDLDGRKVLILGAGMLGLAACAMAKAAGATVYVRDPEPTCRERALAFGASAGDPPARGADVVLELAGVAASVREALERTRIGGVLVLAGTVASAPGIDLDPERIVRRLLTIRGVHNYTPGDLVTALDFLAGPGRGLPFESLVGSTFSLEQTEEAFAQALAHPGIRIAVQP